MTRSSFYKSLKRISGKFRWKLDGPRLRAYLPDYLDLFFCPLESRSLVKYKNTSWSNDGDISQDDIEIIIGAADYPLDKLKGNPAAARARKALFSAVGLTKGL